MKACLAVLLWTTTSLNVASEDRRVVKESCHFDFQDGYTYDLNAFKRDTWAPYRVEGSQNHIYTFNLCNAAAYCAFQTSSVACIQDHGHDESILVGSLNATAHPLTPQDVADVNWKTQHTPPFVPTIGGIKFDFHPIGTLPPPPGSSDEGDRVPMPQRSSRGVTIIAICNETLDTTIALEFATGQNYRSASKGYMFAVSGKAACPNPVLPTSAPTIPPCQQVNCESPYIKYGTDARGCGGTCELPATELGNCVYTIYDIKYDLLALKRSPQSPFRLFNQDYIYSFNLCGAPSFCNAEVQSSACAQDIHDQTSELIGGLDYAVFAISPSDIAAVNRKSHSMFAPNVPGLKMVFSRLGGAVEASGGVGTEGTVTVIAICDPTKQSMKVVKFSMGEPYRDPTLAAYLFVVAGGQACPVTTAGASGSQGLSPSPTYPQFPPDVSNDGAGQRASRSLLLFGILGGSAICGMGLFVWFRNLSGSEHELVSQQDDDDCSVSLEDLSRPDRIELEADSYDEDVIPDDHIPGVTPVPQDFELPPVQALENVDDFVIEDEFESLNPF